MNIDEYLKRLNSSNCKEASIQNLFRLQTNHLLNIPFENLDIHLNNDYESLDLQVLYEKIINKKRGGFCCELNVLFHWLLEQLGYRVCFLTCRPYQFGRRQFAPWFTHMVLLVSMNDSHYLVDVGYSHNFRAPLKFTLNQVQQDVTGHFKIIADNSATTNTTSSTFVILKCAAEDVDQWTPLFEFSNKPKRLNEFRAMIQFVKSKDNPRFQKRFVQHHSFLNKI